jgi:transposase-like protein
MTEKRRLYSVDFKFRVTLEAAKGLKRLNDLTGEHGVHPSQISTRKHQLLDGGPGLFGQNGAYEQREQEALQVDLFKQIGRLKMELAWVKKHPVSEPGLLHTRRGPFRMMAAVVSHLIFAHRWS